MARLTLELAQHEVLALPEACGVRVQCIEGGVWLTLEQDRRDIVLAAGERFAIDRGGLTLLHALAPARVRIDGLPAQLGAARQPGRLARLWQRLAAPLQPAPLGCA